MKCSKLQLQQRMKPRRQLPGNTSTERIQRYCQKRMVDPNHDEDPRWSEGFMERFRCNADNIIDPDDKSDIYQLNQEQTDDLFLSVQTLKFQGDTKDIKDRKRSRTCFKYKSLTDTHRMFVKQIIKEQERVDDDNLSQQNSYYCDDYVNYILNSDRSRPSTGKSSPRDNNSKAVQAVPKSMKPNKPAETNSKNDRAGTKNEKDELITKDISMSDTKITYQKCGKRKSLTISKAQSPETVQVIRVDVVCNYSSNDSVISEPEDKPEDVKRNEKKVTHMSLKNNPFASRYLLTKSMKSLDENVSGGTKVTLLCKTFRLTDRKHVDNHKRKPFNVGYKYYRDKSYND